MELGACALLVAGVWRRRARWRGGGRVSFDCAAWFVHALYAHLRLSIGSCAFVECLMLCVHCGGWAVLCLALSHVCASSLVRPSCACLHVLMCWFACLLRIGACLSLVVFAGVLHFAATGPPLTMGALCLCMLQLLGAGLHAFMPALCICGALRCFTALVT